MPDVMPESVAQRRLLDAAVDAFAEHGFGGTTTRDIAERAGRSQAAVYIHYASKEELLFGISRRGHLSALACLTQASQAEAGPTARIRRMTLDFSLWHLENAKLGRVVQYELRALSDEHRAEIIALRREFHSLMVNALESGIASGEFDVDDVDGTARSLLSLCIDLVRWFDPTLGRDPRAVATLNADLSERIVGASSIPLR